MLSGGNDTYFQWEKERKEERVKDNKKLLDIWKTRID